MTSNQSLATALAAMVILASDRKKVKSAYLQGILLEAIGDISMHLESNGVKMRAVDIRDVTQKTGSWTVPFVADTDEFLGISSIIDVRGMIG